MLNIMSLNIYDDSYLFEDGQCTLRLKGDIPDLKTQLAQRLTSGVLLHPESESTKWPLPVMHAIVSHAWRQANSNKEQHSLRCSCKAARDCTSHLINGTDLSISSPVYEDGAIRSLHCFPSAAVMTSLTLSR